MANASTGSSPRAGLRSRGIALVALGAALAGACAGTRKGGEGAPAAGGPPPTSEARAQPGVWRSLWNGKDLAGWDTWVAAPRGSKTPVGLNTDPHGIFTVVEVDGAPAIRISGEIYGAITTHEELESFHMRVELRWGEKRWWPRANVGRDTGILYNGVGPQGAGSGAWMRSIECNIMEKGIGQWWSVAGTIVDVEGVRVTPEMEAEVPYKKEGKGESIIVYRMGAPTLTAEPRDGVTPAIDPELPRGQWNTVEVVSLGADSVHVVNGKVNMVLTNSRHRDEAGRETPLTRGKIQLQSEGAEVFYRKIEIRPVTAVPSELLPDGEIPRRADRATTSESGFVPLLAAAELAHWSMSGPGRFTVEDGVATGHGGMGLWWYSKKPFTNFVLRGEFQQEPESDSGIFVRFPDPGDDPMVAVKRGHELEIGESKPGKGSTGSIYPFHGPTDLPLRPAGAWNEYELTVVGRRYQVKLNGKLINDWVDDKDRPLAGYVGLQNYPWPGAVRHRNLRIKDLR